MLNWWFVRLGLRAIAYAIIGAICCGTAGSVLGYTAGCGMNAGEGGVFGSSVGVVLGSGLGFFGYLIAAFFSAPDGFWTTLKRLIPFSLLGMATAVSAGAPALLLIALAGLSYLKPNRPEISFFVLALGFPLLMLGGQITGTIAGAKKRWGPREEMLREGITRAFVLAVQAGVIAGFASIPWFARTVIYDDNVPFRMVAGVLAGAAMAPVFAWVMLLFVPALRVTEEKWNRLLAAFTAGCRVSIIPLLLVLARVALQSPHIKNYYDPTEDLTLVPPAQLTDLFGGDRVYALPITPLWLSVVTVVVAGMVVLRAAMCRGTTETIGERDLGIVLTVE